MGNMHPGCRCCRCNPKEPNQTQRPMPPLRPWRPSTQARERQEEATRLYEQKCQDAAEAETIYNEAIKDTLEKTEALEKHFKTVTVRAESLATTEAEFFKTLARKKTSTCALSSTHDARSSI